MKFLSIVGRKEYFEEFAYRYIIDSGMQPENALLKLENVKGLTAFHDDDFYTEIVKHSIYILDAMKINSSSTSLEACEDKISGNLVPQYAYQAIKTMEEEIRKLKEESLDITEKINYHTNIRKQIELLRDLDVNLSSFFNFEYMKFRFGRIPKKSYRQLQLYIDDLDTIMHVVSQDSEYNWIIYFTPRTYSEKVDGVMSSLYFERIWLPGEFGGTPVDILERLDQKLNELNLKLKEINEKISGFIEKNRNNALKYHSYALELARINDVKKMAACTNESFYITGWVPEDEMKKMADVFEHDDKIVYIIEDPENLKSLKPPIKLKNNRFFKPFELFIKMYGLPSYDETDPTAFLAITYFLMFGLMFGDVGQGFLLFLGGYILYKRKIMLGGIIAGAGISAVIFGFLYGSVFGFEDVLNAIWLRPMENINTMLIFAIGFGIILITTAMIINVVNMVKRKEYFHLLLDRNGIAGLIFYWSIIVLALYYLQKGEMPFAGGIVAVIIIIPLLLMFFKEPIENYHKKKGFLPKEKGVFFIQTFFEMFDTILSYLSNTISFIRISAFALNHVGLFMAFLILAEMTKGAGAVFEIILGNIIIVGLEGLIVGIQALRLEYYELFNRFFKGDGREYKPVKENIYKG